MFCPDPNCRCKDSRVVESRFCGGFAVRRTRECLDCSKRFTTFEIIQSNLCNPLDMTKLYKYISEKELKKSPSKTDNLKRKEINRLLEPNETKLYNWIIESESTRNKLYDHLNEQEIFIIRMRFGLDGHEESTTKEVTSWLGISKEKVRSAELKALKFLRALQREKVK